MANIYRNASEVIGWLGNKTLDFDAGFCLLKILIAGSSHQYLEDKAYETSWDALVRLLDRPYWTRVWILQETAINLRVSLRFADDQESEITVKNLSEWDNIRFEAVSKWGELHSGQEWEGSLMQRFHFISNNVYNIGYLPLLYPLTIDEFQLLLQAHIYNGPLATNPLEYVYGILGLFDTHVLSVDYSVSHRDLYHRVIIESAPNSTTRFPVLGVGWLCMTVRLRSRIPSISPIGVLTFLIERDSSAQSHWQTAQGLNVLSGIPFTVPLERRNRYFASTWQTIASLPKEFKLGLSTKLEASQILRILLQFGRKTGVALAVFMESYLPPQD
jgi:hypothetical protein